MSVFKLYQKLYQCYIPWAVRRYTDLQVCSILGSTDLREPPIFTKELTDMEVSDGDRVEMSVEVKGQCSIAFVW